MPGDAATKFDVAHRALEFRTELDALLQRHGARMLLGWDGKWAKVQVTFPEASGGIGLTIMETRKGGRVRYVQDIEEVAKKTGDAAGKGADA
ncbi:MAG TPA: hypothetical protein VIG97_07315 [Luteimonas sp.]